MTIDTFPVPAARSGSLLRTVLVADAALCVTAGAAFLLATGPAAAMFGAPEAAIAAVGALLLSLAAALAWLSRRPTVPARAVKALVAADLLWVVDTIAVTALGWIAPTTTGLVVVLAQAVLVLAFAVAKTVALRRGA
jgi:hypothetical protein